MFEWTDAGLGGAMIGLASAGLLLSIGRVAGISGILTNALVGTSGLWRWAFLAGLVASPLWSPILGLRYAIAHHQGGPLLLIAAGLLVGVGTQLGSGCTSGHGVCGIANLSLRSLVAVVVFMLTAMLVVALARHVLPVFVGG